MKKILLYLLFILSNTVLFAQLGSNDATFNVLDDGTLGDGSGVTTFESSIRGSIVQPDGKIIFVGTFFGFDGFSRNGIVRLTEDGYFDSSFGPGIGFNNGAFAVAQQPDGKILVGGFFTTYNGVTANRIIRLNSDGTIDASFNAGASFNSGVTTIKVLSDGKILVGGYFTTYNGVSTNRIAKLNSDGSLDNTFNIGNGANDIIWSIDTFSNGKILVGGRFTSFNSVTANRLTILNADGSLDNSFVSGSGLNGEVYNCIATSQDKIVLVGDFTQYNGSTHNRILSLNLDGTININLNFGTGANQFVSVIKELSDGKLLVAGLFNSFNGLNTGRMVKINNDGTVDGTFNAGTGANGFTFTLTVLNNNKIFVAGDFDIFSNNRVNKLTLINSNGSLDFSFRSIYGANSTVNCAIELNNNSYLIGGDFSTYNKTSANRIVKINNDGTIDNSFVSGTGFDRAPLAMALQADGKIIVGGNFNLYNGVTFNGLIRLNPDGSIDNTFNIGTGFGGLSWQSLVNAIAIQSDGKIILAGGFNSFNNITLRGIVRLNQNGSLDNTFNVGTGLDGTSGRFESVALQSDGKIIAGGNFVGFNGNSSIRSIVRLNTNGSIDNTFNIGTGPNNPVNSLAVSSTDKIIVTGSFNAINGTSRSRIAQLNADGSVDLSFNPGSGTGFQTAEAKYHYNDKIILYGSFTTYNNSSANRIVVLNQNGTIDNNYNFGTGFNSVINSVTDIIVDSQNNLLAVGNFNSFNGTPRNRVARIIGSCQENITQSVVTDEPYTWIDGVTYTTSNNTATFTQLGAGANGCDIITTLNLIISKPNLKLSITGENLSVKFKGNPSINLNTIDLQVKNQAQILSDQETITLKSVNESFITNQNPDTLTFYNLLVQHSENPTTNTILPFHLNGNGDFRAKNQLNLAQTPFNYNNSVVIIDSGATFIAHGRVRQNPTNMNAYLETSETLPENSNSNFANLGVEITSRALPLGKTIVRRYHVEATSGTFPNNNRSITRLYKILPVNNSNLNVDVNFQYNDLDLLGENATHEEQNLALYKTTENITNPELAVVWEKVNASLNQTTNTITATNVNSFSWWTKADEVNNPLPIVLNYFTAQCSNGLVNVNWETASEINNHYFIIEASENGQEWNTLDVVEGAGFSNQTLSYRWVQPEKITKPTYYRLTQVDFDQTQETFEPFWVEPCGESAFQFFTVNPQTVPQTKIFFNHNLTADQVMFSVFNAHGQLISQFTVWAEPGENTYQLNTKLNKNGLYVITAQFKNQTQSVKHIYNP